MRYFVDKASGLLEGASQQASPNQDERPHGELPSLIVVHGISLPPGEFGGPWIDALFKNRLDPRAHSYFSAIHQLRVSAHLLLRRDGGIVQYVPFHRRAWHAGESSWAGREACNDYAIGIELEGCDDQAYASAQYHALAGVISALRCAYPALQQADIVGHSEIAPGRKTDPGPAFDWPHLHALLEKMSCR